MSQGFNPAFFGAAGGNQQSSEWQNPHGTKRAAGAFMLRRAAQLLLQGCAEQCDGVHGLPQVVAGRGQEPRFLGGDGAPGYRLNDWRTLLHSN